MKILTAQKGVTLIELITVVAVVAILASIAVGSYRSYLIRANRSEAKAALLRVQVAQEKFFLQYNRYAQTNAELAAAPGDSPPGLGILTTTANNYYNIGLAAGATANITYVATATAINGQTSDVAACQTMTIDETGARTPSPDPSGCWK